MIRRQPKPGLHPGLEKEYALDFHTPMSHLVRELEGARQSGRAPSLEDLTQSYTDTRSGDLARVKRYEKLTTDWEARQFLMAKAIEALGSQVIETAEGSYALTVPQGETRWGEVQLRGEPLVDVNERFNDPFNPMTGGPFSENVRTITVRKDNESWTELRESMRAFGWLDYHPAIQDERGAVIVGHRRLQVAKELGIEPKIVTHTFGRGDGADADRLKMAIGSNMGAAGLHATDRKKLALYLYNEQEWSMERIADALHVNTRTVSRDLAGLAHAKPERGGRPRKTTRKLTDEQQLAIAEKRWAGAPFQDLQTEYGISAGLAQSAIEYGRGISDREPCPHCHCPCCHDTGYVAK